MHTNLTGAIIKKKGRYSRLAAFPRAKEVKKVVPPQNGHSTDIVKKAARLWNKYVSLHFLVLKGKMCRLINIPKNHVSQQFNKCYLYKIEIAQKKTASHTINLQHI